MTKDQRVISSPSRVYNSRKYHYRKRGILPELEYFSIEDCLRASGLGVED